MNSGGRRARHPHKVTGVISAFSLAVHKDKGVDDPGEVTCFAGSNKGSNSEVQSLSSFQSDSGDDNGKPWVVAVFPVALPHVLTVGREEGKVTSSVSGPDHGLQSMLTSFLGWSRCGVSSQQEHLPWVLQRSLSEVDQVP